MIQNLLNHILFVLLLSLFCGCCWGAVDTAFFNRIDLDDGLSQSGIYAIAQDHKGFMWFGTQDGLNRYDGYDFKIFKSDQDVPNSLPHNWIRALFVDRNNRLWIGTLYGGLSYYDAKTETFHRPLMKSAVQQKIIEEAAITSIVNGRKGELIIGTWHHGLLVLNLHKGLLKQYKHTPGIKHGLQSNWLKAVQFDGDETVWMGTLEHGLYSLNFKTEEFKHYLPDPDNPTTSLSDTNILSLYLDADKYLWIGTDHGGLNRLNTRNDTLQIFKHDPDDLSTISDNEINVIELFDEEHLMLGTFGGLNIINRNTFAISYYQHQSDNIRSLSSDTIYSLSKGSDNLIWIGTQFAGLNVLNTESIKFNHQHYTGNNVNTVKSNSISCFFEDSKGRFWVGSNDNGLFRYDPVSKTYKHYYQDDNDVSSLSKNYVISVMEDHQNIIWVVTYNGSIQQYNETQDDFIHFRPSDSDFLGTDSNKVLNIYEDSQKRFWVGTIHHGLLLFDRVKEQFIRFKDAAGEEVPGNGVSSFMELPNGDMLMGGNDGGISLLSAKTNLLTSSPVLEQINPIVNGNMISNMMLDSRQRVWISSSGRGLLFYDLKTQEVGGYKVKDGLPDDHIYGTLEDKDGNIWVSTNKGLSKFNPDLKTFKNFDKNSGLQSNEFNFNAFYKTRDGKFYFGGINGFNSFFPRQILSDNRKPNIVITDFLLSNKSVSIRAEDAKGNIETAGDDQSFSLQSAIGELDNLILPYDKSLFTFSFSALHFSNPLKNQYKYKLDGWDEEWIISDSKIRRATYTNIPAGDYVFRVKASNPDGLWNEKGASLSVKILPAPWRSWWAYLIYCIAIIAVLLVLWRWFIEKNRAEQEHRALQKERELSNRLQQLDKLKDEFLANTSHELRTPLNGIIGLAELLIEGASEELSEEEREYLSMIAYSGKRLAHLVNDILDFSKLKNNTIELQFKNIDLRSLVDVIITLSKPLVGNKPVEIINCVDANLPQVKADENRLQQILYNLIGNAIKFTKRGYVEVASELEDGRVIVSVKDTGIGIAKEKLESIFEYFEQADGSIEREYAGTGLGLAVTKKLAKLHGSEIHVESRLGEGSIFSFSLSVGEKVILQEVQSADNILEKINLDYKLSVANDAELIKKQYHLRKSDSYKDNEKTQVADDEEQELMRNKSLRILVVDDDNVNRKVIKSYLKLKNYTIIEAVDGAQALDIFASGQKVDLIILDVMMPKISGYDVCKKIRESCSREEVPILFLSASHSKEETIEGYRLGCNDYLTKPISRHELLARVKTYLELKQLHVKYEGEIHENISEVP